MSIEETPMGMGEIGGKKEDVEMRREMTREEKSSMEMLEWETTNLTEERLKDFLSSDLSISDNWDVIDEILAKVDRFEENVISLSSKNSTIEINTVAENEKEFKRTVEFKIEKGKVSVREITSEEILKDILRGRISSLETILD